jgi:hypothetical protein
MPYRTLSSSKPYRSWLVAGACTVMACASTPGTSATAALQPASSVGGLRAVEQDPFRFVQQSAEPDAPTVPQNPLPCEFRVESISAGVAIHFSSRQLAAKELAAQVNRLAQVFNRHRARGQESPALEATDVGGFGMKRVLELEPQAIVHRSTTGVSLVFTDPERSDLLELRARVRWHAPDLLSDPARTDGRPLTCTALPDGLEKELLTRSTASRSAS